MNVLKYYVKSAYGVDRMYPANRAAQVICELARQKTLDARLLALASELGYQSTEVLKRDSEV